MSATRRASSMLRWFTLSCCAVLALVAARPATAQGVDDSIQFRNDCRLAVQVLQTGQPANHRSWALQVIQSCADADAAAAVAGAWQTPSTNADDVDWLVAASIANRDARIFQAVTTVARDQSASELFRAAAFRVLASYADRRVWVSMSDLVSRRALILPFTDHPTGRDGTAPLPPDVRTQVLAAFAEVGAAEPNQSIREMAQFLTRAFPSP